MFWSRRVQGKSILDFFGFSISQEHNRFEKNMSDLLDKVRKTINFWKIFNLSLSGKLTIVKSVVYPIVNQYLSVLQPSENWLETFMTLTEDFIMQNMNVSREKCYMDLESGGLGLFRPDIFFKALTCSWALLPGPRTV
jgi:hypothetical protein